ncbi:MAG: 30S ribosomal protein S8 [Candidatus Yanofskybacteria bacterium]|nr:30S ribosomal protein S8 [Candidatus Yanofskybacteria bacterium]
MVNSVADMLIRIKNAQMAGKERVLVPFSRAKFDVAKILKENGLVQEIERKKKKVSKTEQVFLEVKLDLSRGIMPIAGIKIFSKPSRRVYLGKKDIKPVVSGYGISIISTSRGIMSGQDARKNNLGGELIAEVW